MACIWSGYDDLGELELQELRDLKPQSDADRLLKAYAMLSYDPQESQRLLRDSPGLQRSPIGLLIRGFSESILLAHSGERDIESTDRAVRDFEYVQYLFNDNQASVGFRLLALGTASDWHVPRDGMMMPVDMRKKGDHLLSSLRLSPIIRLATGLVSNTTWPLGIVRRHGKRSATWASIREHIHGFLPPPVWGDMASELLRSSTGQSFPNIEIASMSALPERI